MPCTHQRFALVMALAVSISSLQTVQAQGNVERMPYQFKPDDVIEAQRYEIPEKQAAPIDGYLTRKAAARAATRA